MGGFQTPVLVPGSECWEALGSHLLLQVPNLGGLKGTVSPRARKCVVVLSGKGQRPLQRFRIVHAEETH